MDHSFDFFRSFNIHEILLNNDLLLTICRKDEK